MKLKTTLFICFTALFTYQIQAQCTGAQFQEVNGIAVIEAENGTRPSAWARETGISGATGGAYMAYRGSDSFGGPSSNVARYTVRINSPGTYRFIWRNRIGIIASSNANTEHNDSWLRFPNASNFYGQKGSSRIFPRGGGSNGPYPEGASASGYFKIYTNTLGWNWSTNTSDNDAHQIYVVFNNAGVYTIEVSGRSRGHFIDRMVLYKESQYSLSSAQSTNRSQTTCSGGGGTPPPPPPPPPPSGGTNSPTVNITNPNNGQNFSAGSNVTVSLTSNDTDGDITKHEIFVNNVKVDTDGSSYSPHIISNISSGSYAIRALVTDSGGRTGSSTVNITVGGGSPPPPPPPTGSNNPPSVSITNPSNGQSFSAGSNVSVGVSASDSDGSVVKYQIFVNGALVDTDGSAYTPHIISNISSGSYAIKATVTDNDGATASTTVNISVGSGTPPPPPPSGGNNPPSVNITSPSNGQNFSPGSNVSVGVSASDSDGSVVKYQIFVNGVLVDTDGSFFTPHPINNISAGSYAIKATVTDNDGATASTTVNITVGGSTTPPPPPSGGGGITFYLVNAITNTDKGPMPNGNNIAFPTNINIRAASSFSGTKSVYFMLTGPVNRIWTENAAPYALYADVNGNYNSVNLPNGSYTLTAEAWSGSNRSGTKLGSSTINFTAGTNLASKVVGQVYVYPNPIKNGKFSVKLPAEVTGDVSYRLISTSGVEVEAGNLSIDRAGGNAEFNLSSFDNKNNGVYYLMLQTNTSRYTVPLIKK